MTTNKGNLLINKKSININDKHGLCHLGEKFLWASLKKIGIK